MKDERGMRTQAQKEATRKMKNKLQRKVKFNPDRDYLNMAIEQFIRRGGRIQQVTMPKTNGISRDKDEPPPEVVPQGRIDNFPNRRTPLIITMGEAYIYHAY